MKREELARVREEAAAAVKKELEPWHTKLAKLQGISEGLLGRGKGDKPGNVVMAKKLCCYYMRKEGFTLWQIADFMGYATHVTPRHHINDCVDFIENKVLSDRDYLKAHKLAKENGIW